MSMIKVRFHLGRGENYMKWRVEGDDKQVSFYNPQHVQLVMSGCKLRNQKSAAKKIFSGENKTVCAWIDCEEVQFFFGPINMDKQLVYNPRKQPNWTLNGEDVDGKQFEELRTIDNKIFIQ